MPESSRPSGVRGGVIRLLVSLVAGAVMAVGSCTAYVWNTEDNPVTGESQRVAMSPEAEVALGLASAPELAGQYGGLDPDRAAQAAVDAVGGRLAAGLEEEAAARGAAQPYPLEFHLLDDAATVNAFALPGGQVFVTEGLYRLLRSEDELAGVLGHEIGHVVRRHASQRIALERRNEGFRRAAQTVTGDGRATALAVAVAGLSYGRRQEIEADRWAVTLLNAAGYSPAAMLTVIDTLERAGGRGGPEFLSTHPASDSRREAIAEAIDAAPRP